jgi:MoaA/NifB/PqqE/SkfB family radical SAM enzyme
MEVKDNPYFCEHIWTHLYKHTDDNIKLCCIDEGESLGNLRNNSLDEIRNGEEFKKIRKDVLSGKKLDRCYRCFDAEERGLDSYRIKAEEARYSNYTEEAKPLKFLDFRADNVCNLACKSCGSPYSTKLIDADLKIGNITQEEAKKLRFVNKENKNISEISNKLYAITDIYFAGGEPLLNQQHWDILEGLKKTSRLKNTAISYNTNLTVLEFKEYSVENYWPYIKNLNIMASIDGMGSSFEYFRTGAKWDTILKNIDRVNKIKPGSLSITSTFHWMNLGSVIELFKFLTENELIKHYTSFDFNFMYGPRGGVEYTPPFARPELLRNIRDFKKYLKHRYNIDDNSHFYKKIITIEDKIINSEYHVEDFKKWVKKLKIIDFQYKTNIKSILNFKDDIINQKILKMYESITFFDSYKIQK